MRLFELAALTGARIEGTAADIEIASAAGLDEAAAGQVTFLANPRYTPRVQTVLASSVPTTSLSGKLLRKSSTLNPPLLAPRVT